MEPSRCCSCSKPTLPLICRTSHANIGGHAQQRSVYLHKGWSLFTPDFMVHPSGDGGIRNSDKTSPNPAHLKEVYATLIIVPPVFTVWCSDCHWSAQQLYLYLTLIIFLPSLPGMNSRSCARTRCRRWPIPRSTRGAHQINIDHHDGLFKFDDLYDQDEPTYCRKQK